LKNFFEPGFDKYFKKLPPPIRKKAAQAFRHLEKQDQLHFSRGLELKPIRGALHRIRIGDGYRALGYKTGNGVRWEWIGPHDEYMRRIKQL
jgi:mRNA-degrading endonuclease RelE of RelBE toxin-antitoxin system